MGNNEDAALVLMLKNHDTGFFEKELGQYKIGINEDLINGLYAEKTEEGIMVCLRVSTGNTWADISDELYEHIYDSYDADQLPDFITEFIEIDGCFNPTWEARFLFSESPVETEDMITQSLAAHKKALMLLHQGNID